MVVTGTDEEAVVVAVLSTQGPLDFLQFFLEAIGGVVEALEDTRDGRDVVIFLLNARAEFLTGLLCPLHGIGRNQKFIGFCCDTEAVVLVEGNGEIQTQTQVRRDELGILGAAIVDFGTDIADIQAHG